MHFQYKEFKVNKLLAANICLSLQQYMHYTYLRDEIWSSIRTIQNAHKTFNMILF